MEIQRKIADERAINVKGQKYGVEYKYELNGKQELGKTSYEMKTVGNLMDMILKSEKTQNLKPFDENDYLLGYSVLLADVKTVIKIQSLDEGMILRKHQEDMIFLHFCGQTTQSFMVNKKQLTLQNIIDELEVKNKNLEIMGKKITQDMLGKFLSELTNDKEICIRECD